MLLFSNDDEKKRVIHQSKYIYIYMPPPGPLGIYICMYLYAIPSHPSLEHVTYIMISVDGGLRPPSFIGFSFGRGGGLWERYFGHEAM